MIRLYDFSLFLQFGIISKTKKKDMLKKKEL